ncbi:helix-turn-helix transcriptional regulator [Flavitalea sp. BT771]|uniref:helix-turn-helix transcriptional regulator n=1 Tax=Flavitalea sp. BT771 TaxID=3063329 RepID=UPI0026E2FF02|nr:helix-turn-helix transcriptional regulator [Flavitalea sp. BT771]MDO6434455.1 helix-turn-helix transcriptional regulator [Flavitalea sp. BT771]MDV6223355.1 helix-turn-helix transcriptional regulator [Flavitalea sp. BT771]
MAYTSLSPHPALASYIDAYWSVRGPVEGCTTSRILPDGCVDIIYNVGEDMASMKSGSAYLVGTMTRPFDSTVTPGTRLLGIRFKPAAFSAFYRFSSLHELTDDAIECEKGLAPALSTLRDPVAGLNAFFLAKLSSPKHVLFPVLEDIHRHHGLVRVEELTKRHFITVRQLERSFKYHIGVSPKEFINQVRFRRALQVIRHKRPDVRLGDIAEACGYYDQAHLANEIRKYTGASPVRL